MPEAPLLPPFPVDPATLDLLSAAIDPQGAGDTEATRSSVGEFLDLMSQLGGSDVDAVESVEQAEVFGEVREVHVMRDPAYHQNDVITALIAEVRRLRVAKREGTDG